MTDIAGAPMKSIIDRDMLMRLKTCAVCGRPFTLGEPVVLACGPWEGPMAWIHEAEAVADPQTGMYNARVCVNENQ